MPDECRDVARSLHVCPWEKYAQDHPYEEAAIRAQVAAVIHQDGTYAPDALEALLQEALTDDVPERAVLRAHRLFTFLPPPVGRAYREAVIKSEAVRQVRREAWRLDL